MQYKKKIFIIDDEENIRNAIKRMLHESFYPPLEVIETGNGEEALEIAKKERPELILLDVLMTGINGLQVLKDLKANESKELRKIPVIMLTGVGNREVMAKSKRLGAVDYITKPFNEKVFLLKIKKYIDYSQEKFLKKERNI